MYNYYIENYNITTYPKSCYLCEGKVLPDQGGFCPVCSRVNLTGWYPEEIKTNLVCMPIPVQTAHTSICQIISLKDYKKQKEEYYNYADNANNFNLTQKVANAY